MIKRLEMWTARTIVWRPGRRQSGQDGIAPRNVISVRRYPKYKLRIFTQENTPRGYREGGENEVPNRTDIQETESTDQRIMSSKCVCGKTCKNLRGLKIHQCRMKCLMGGRQEQRTGQDPDQTQEKQGQEVHHRTQSLHANVAPKSTSTTTNIKWPPSNSIGDWQNFDKDVCEIARLSSKGSVEARIELLTWTSNKNRFWRLRFWQY